MSYVLKMFYYIMSWHCIINGIMLLLYVDMVTNTDKVLTAFLQMGRDGETFWAVSMACY